MKSTVRYEEIAVISHISLQATFEQWETQDSLGTNRLIRKRWGLPELLLPDPTKRDNALFLCTAFKRGIRIWLPEQTLKK